MRFAGPVLISLLILNSLLMADELVLAQIVARDRVLLSSQINTIVNELKVREGDSFASGQTLIDLDCRSYRAQLAQALAAERLARAILQNTESLARLESVSLQEVDKARAELDISIQAKILAQLDVQRCSVKAPFTGAVVSLEAGKGEYLGPGKALMEIVGTENLEVHFLIPSNKIKSIKTGQSFNMDVHETKSRVKGRIRQIAPVADPLNRTIKVMGELDGKTALIKPGMSGSINLKELSLENEEKKDSES